jgi:hypothetical protein
VNTIEGHTLVVEHTNQGVEMTQGEKAHEFTVHYTVRHPEGCDPDEALCVFEEHIEAVGIEETLGLGRDPRHLTDGLYDLSYWSRTYDGPEGRDYESGVTVRPATEEDQP